MAKKNAYLARREAVNQGFLDVGEEMGVQKMWDYIQIALRDPDVMGKDVFGRKRLEKLYKKCSEYASHYHTAFTDDKEADYCQVELDAQLREIWGKDLTPFYDRYPYLKKIDYTKGKKEWKN